jgi:hypothetical protein
MPLKFTYDFPENAPNYPDDFYAVPDGIQWLKVKNQFLLAELRDVERGECQKSIRMATARVNQSQFTTLKVSQVAFLT